MKMNRCFIFGLVLCIVSMGAVVWAQSGSKLAQQMKSAKDEKDLLAARDDLVKMGKEGAAGLESVLADTAVPPQARVNAAWGLAKLVEDSGGGFGVSELAKFTNDANPAVRYLAYKALLNPVSRYAKADALLLEALKDKSVPVRILAIRNLAARKENPRVLAELIADPNEEREVKEEAEAAFEAITGFSLGFRLAVKRDPNNPKAPIPDPEQEKAVMAKYAEWAKKSK